MTPDYWSRLLANRTMGVVEARCWSSFVVASKPDLDGKGSPVSDLQLAEWTSLWNGAREIIF